VSEPTPGPVRTTAAYGLAAAPADGTALPWSTVARWLRDARSYWVATTRPDGRPHAMPVWGVWLDDALWFSTDPASVKARNVAARPDVVVHLDSGDEVCVLEGGVRRVAAGDLPDGFLDAYRAKYEAPVEPDNPDHGLFVVVPTVALTWTEAEFTTTPTRWTWG
jgi:PPOX class probable F420-dependent enzyme